MTSGHEESLARRVGELVVDAVESAGAVAPPVAVRPVGALERERGHAAKLKQVRNLVR